jgi:hypothetical protein
MRWYICIYTLDGKSNYDRHDKTFKKWTAKIASLYGFDPKEL